MKGRLPDAEQNVRRAADYGLAEERLHHTDDADILARQLKRYTERSWKVRWIRCRRKSQAREELKLLLRREDLEEATRHAIDLVGYRLS